MSLQFVLGNSGSGKSEWLYRRMIKEASDHPDRNYVVIVPEQFSMQTQRELVRLSGRGGILNIDVLSFPRLAHRVFEETGYDQRSVLTETGKNLMIRALSIRLEQELPVFGKRMSQDGYVSGIKSVLSELMQYEVSEAELDRLIRSVDDRPLLQAKLKDIRTLYRAYLEDQRERLAKPEELLDSLCRAAESSSLIRESVFALDCFTGFTPSQKNVLKELMRLSGMVWVTVTTGAEEPWTGEIQEHELFALSKKTIRSVMELAKEASVLSRNDFEILPPVLLGQTGCPRFVPGGELAFLERNLFRKGRQKVWDLSGASGDAEDRAGSDLSESAVSLHEARTPADEVLYAAKTIAVMLKSGSVRCRDIAVITGNMDSYENHIRHLFKQYEIPVFIDQTRRIALNPCLEFVKAAIEVVRRDFSEESVLRLLRTELILPDADAVDRLENFILAAGIRGWNMWKLCWSPDVTEDPGVQEEPAGCLFVPAHLKEEGSFCEIYRKELTVLLAPFVREMSGKGKTAGHLTESLYDLMAACSLQQKLADRQKMLEEDGRMDIAAEYAQIYGMVLHLLDEIAELLGDKPVSLREYAEILDAGLAEARVGMIPPGIDEVQVGDMERSRLAHVRYLFFLGLNDGWVPPHTDRGGIISDMEREILKENGADLAPAQREENYIQRFYLYQNLTKAEERLLLSWCRNDGDGKPVRPSYVIAVIRRMFPHLQVRQERPQGEDLTQIASWKTAVPYLARGLREARFGRMDSEWKEVYRSFRNDPETQKKLEALTDTAFLTAQKCRLSPDTARNLYGDVLENSVTRLELFSSCAFEHFVSYGLKLQERDQHEIRTADLGILFHQSLERYSRQLAAEGISDWSRVAADEQAARMNRCVDQAAETLGKDLFTGNARNAYVLTRVKRILGRSVWALTRQLAEGKFVPAAYEVAFRDLSDTDIVRIRLEDGSQMHLQGRIDRIDRFETEDSVYIKIVDYKSGLTKFDPSALYFGLQLQLMTYLDVALSIEKADAAAREGKEVLPAGVLYYHLQDPFLNRSEAKDAAEHPELLEEKVLKKLRPDGVVNREIEVLEALNRKGSGDSIAAPFGWKKDRELKKNSHVLTSGQFEAALQFTRKTLRQGADRIRSGEIEAAPYRMGNQAACTYCPYGDVCGFDRKIPGTRERILPKLPEEEVWKRMEKETICL